MLHYCKTNNIVNRTVAFFLWLCVAMALTISSAHAEQNEVLTDIEYTHAEQRLLDAGFPLIDEYWAVKEFKAAQEAILAISTDDPAGLPRLTNNKTGLVSRLLLELDNLSSAMEEYYGESETPEEYKQALELVGKYTNEITLPIWHAFSHMPDGANIMYEREMLSVLQFLVRQMGLMAQIMTHFNDEMINSGVELTEKFYGSFHSYQAVQGRVTNAMINVTMNPGYKHPDLRATLFSDCKEAFIHLLEVMPEKDREEAVFKLDTLMKFTQNLDEREVIGEILSKSSD